MRLNFLVKFIISGLNQEQIFEKLRQKNITVQDIRRVSQFETTFLVRSCHKKEVENLLNSFGVKVQGIKPKSFERLKKSIALRCGVVFGVIVSLVMGLISNFFVFRIEVLGTSLVSKQEIIGFLSEKGVKPICGKTLIDNDKIELDIVQNFSEISMVSVAVKGLSLIVNVKEKNSALHLKPQNIVADFNGRIKEITVANGRALVSAGSVVKKGDILVAGENDNVEGGLRASAQIVAEVWIEEKYVHYDSSIQKVRTGKSEEVKIISSFGLEIFKGQQQKNFKNFEVEQKTNQIKNLVLPIKITTLTYYELEDKTIAVPYSAQKQQILDTMRQNALQKVQSGDIIQSENVFEEMGSGITYVTYVITSERHIF